MQTKSFKGFPYSLTQSDRFAVGAGAKEELNVPAEFGLAGRFITGASWETSAVGLLLELRVNGLLITRGVELGTSGLWEFGRSLEVANGRDAVVATLINTTSSSIFVRALNLWTTTP